MLEETLFYFLRSICNGYPQATTPLLADQAALRALYRNPPPDLQKAVRHCLDAFLIELDPDPARWGTLRIPAELLGITLAAYNSLALASIPRQPDDQKTESHPASRFTAALLDTLPPARDRNATLGYHAILNTLFSVKRIHNSQFTIHNSQFSSLIELSPLTALTALDIHLPSALMPLAAELLPGWQKKDQQGKSAWHSPKEWLAVISELLSDQRIARWLRHRWLAMPETREACRNLGLLLEALRRQGECREVILEFYEAYDHFCAQTQPDGWGKTVRRWPILGTIAKLLRAPGDNEAAIQVSRRGNEYFLKFRPLVELIMAEHGIPTDYKHLSLTFVRALRPLLPYITSGAHQRVSFGEIAFAEEETGPSP